MLASCSYSISHNYSWISHHYFMAHTPPLAMGFATATAALAPSLTTGLLAAFSWPPELDLLLSPRPPLRPPRPLREGPGAFEFKFKFGWGPRAESGGGPMGGPREEGGICGTPKPAPTLLA